MLEYKINKRGFSLSSNKLNYDSIKFDDNRGVIIVKSDKRRIISSDALKFMRSKGDSIFFEEYVTFNIVGDNTIEFPIFPDYKITPNEVHVDLGNITEPTKTVKGNALYFTFGDNKHSFIDESKYGAIKISENIMPNTEYWKTQKRRCAGDWVIYNDIYLLRAIGVNANGSYVFDGRIYNTRHDIYFIDNNGNKVILKDCLVPFRFSGYDDIGSLLWYYDDNEKDLRDYIVSNFHRIEFMTHDDRFYSIYNDSIAFVKDTLGTNEVYSGLYIEDGHTNINIFIDEHFEYNMNQDINFGAHIDEVIEENVNDIIDMEKQIFSPVIMNNSDAIDYIDNINSLNFNIRLRKRLNTDGLTNIDNLDKNPDELLERTIIGWKNDEIFNQWNNIDDNGGDLLGYLGYSDDDIYYKKKNIKKSFIRLSFYDTMSPSTQSLLYYSTIFFDTGMLYGRYCKNITNGTNRNDVSVLKQPVDNKGLMAQFSIKGVQDRYNSSEGYHLYLFPSLCKGTQETDIYLKIEFNHAKFGKTIPLVLPNNGIPKDYYITEDGGMKGMKALFEDLYIKVKIRYDMDRNKYIWYFSDDRVNNKIDKTINLTLFEPIVNKEINK